jgi:hypothetical protein
MKRALVLLAFASLAAPLFAESKTVLSNVYGIDRKYKSMEGPSGSQTVYLADPAKPELLWITGIRTEVVGEDGKTPMSPELMCHMNVEIDPAMHRTLFGLKRMPASRLITVSQGMMMPTGGFTARLPKGFGFPFISSEPLVVMTQVLNHNFNNAHFRVRHKVTIEYTRDAGAHEPFLPLFNLGASSMVILADRPSVIAGTATAVPEHGPSCLAMPRAPNAAGMSSDYTDAKGNKLTGHWVVPPGRQENHSDIAMFVALPYDTRIHYAAIHLHPFATSLKLRDMTTGQTLIEAKAKSPSKRIGLDHVDTITSLEGIPLKKDHQYELVSVYDNTTNVNQDSMASMFFGLADPEFVRPTKAQLEARVHDVAVERMMSFVLHTTAGDVLATLQRDLAPSTANAFARLAQGNLLSHARVARTAASGKSSMVTFSVPRSEAMRLPMSVPLDGYTHHDGATVSLCPVSGPALEFVLESGDVQPQHDRRCISFARVIWGEDLVRMIATAPLQAQATVEVTKVDAFGADATGSGMALQPAKPLTAPAIATK